MERVFQSRTRRCEQAEPPYHKTEKVHFSGLPNGRREEVFPKGTVKGSEQDRKEVSGDMREEKTYTHWDAMALQHRTPKQQRNNLILTLDEPMDCNECPLHDISSMQGDKLCLASGKRWIETQNLGKKPEWCPLKELPMKKNTQFSGNLVYANGWNACLEEILDEDNSDIR